MASGILNHSLLSLLIIALITTEIFCAAGSFDLSSTNKHGTVLTAADVNIQTTIDFIFSSNTLSSSTSSLVNPVNCKVNFLDVYGNDLTLTLTEYLYSSVFNSFVTNYGTPSVTVEGTYLFKFTSGSFNLYLLVPVTTTASNNIHLLDLTSTKAPTNAIYNFNAASGTLSAFNLLDQTEINIFYTSTVGNNIILVSYFVFKVSSIGSPSSTAASSTAFSAVTSTDWNGAMSTYGDKIGHAATQTTGNFQTHLRQSVPLWFIWFMTFFYWLFYLITPASNISVYDKRFEQNQMTIWPFYSFYHLAHEEYFTRLSRLTVLLLNWTIQAVFLASIYGNQPGNGPEMIIWTAAIAFVATIPFPFIIGSVFLKKIYEKNLIKFDKQRQIKGEIERKKVQPIEKQIQILQQKLYGYWHWYYSIFFMIYFICWPIAINQMQKLPRQDYFHHWYWLASMFVTFAIEHFIYEPILISCFGDKQLVRERGGSFYNFRLGEAFKASQNN